MLYGIRDFYPKFGYATAGPDWLALLTGLDRDNVLPSGWSVRPFAPGDIGAVQTLYAHATRLATGAAVRADDCSVWERMLKPPADAKDDACHVVLGPEGVIRGYVWRASWCWYVKHALEPEFPRALVIGEAMADGPVAADAVLAACRLLARESPPARKIKEVLLACPTSDPISVAAMRQDARLVRSNAACGGSMARVLNVKRLLTALSPELEARLRAAHCKFAGSLVLRTDIGTAALKINSGRISVLDDAPPATGSLAVSLPQAEKRTNANVASAERRREIMGSHGLRHRTVDCCAH